MFDCCSILPGYWLRLVCATHILRLVGRIFGRNTELVGGAKRPIRITKRRTSDFDGVGGTGFQNLLGLLRLGDQSDGRGWNFGTRAHLFGEWKPDNRV